MSLLSVLLLFLAGIVAGIVGATAGLASLISYPAMLAVGLPPVVANMSNTVSLFGSSVGSVLAGRPEFVGQWPVIRKWAPLAVLAGGVGAVLLLVSPPGSFATIVPVLVLMASILLLFSTRVRRAGLRRQQARAAAGGAERPDGGVLVTVLVTLTCVYGGYFGAAAGVMILAVLLSATNRTLPVANALKNLLLGLSNLVSSLLFVIVGTVAWAAVPPMMLGGFIGGRIGPTVVRRVNPTALRWVIGLAGIGLAVHLGIQAWWTA